MIVPAESTSIASEVGGRVTSIRVAAGRDVAAGAIVLEIESDETVDAHEQARLRLRIASERLATVRTANVEGKPLAVTEQFNVAARSRQMATDRLTNYSLIEAEQAYADAKAATERTRSLMKLELATTAELQQSVERERAEARNLAAAREHHSRLKQEVETADSQLKLAQFQMESKDSGGLESAQFDYEEARRSLEAVERQLRGTRVRTPVTGSVVKVHVRTGDRVFIGTPLVQLANLSTLSLETPVAAEVAKRIKEGDPVKARIPTNPPVEVASVVKSVTLAPDERYRTYVVRVDVPNPRPGTVLAGLEGAVEFTHLAKR
jgi:multidrug resistance efflux pump